LAALTERSKNMINEYFVIPLVFGIVLSYLWLIHRLWLRSVFREDHKPTVDTKIAGDVGNFGGSNLGWPGKMVAAQIGRHTLKATTE
jgi:hypothetical protein